MKTPEEIKKGLECCTSKKIMCDECPYYEGMVGCKGIEKDALAYINQLEQRLAQAERERDAAVDDARNGTMCDTCKHNNSKDYLSKPCYECNEAFTCWEWRGVCEENSK